MKKISLIAAALLMASAAQAYTQYEQEDEYPWFVAGVSLVSAPIQIPTTIYSVYGVMIDVGYGQVTDVYLLNVGLVNNVTRNMVGIQAGVINVADDLQGLQAGVFNYAGEAYGFQVGVVNVTGHLHGMQLGVINCNMSGMPVFPIFNIGF